MSSPAVILVCPSKDDLSRFCRGDLPTYRLDELAAHLETCDECQSSLDELSQACDDLLTELRGIGPLDAAADPAMAGEMAALESQSALLGDTVEERFENHAEPPLPARLGEYAVLETIGCGGMGTVYRAVHMRLDKLVAIKVLSPHRMGDAAAVTRFDREMRAVGKLSHSHIVAATDAGEFAGAPFLVMEYIEGVDLARLIKHHGRLGVAEACEIVRQAALGLHYAHSHGLVHRDIKPSNLLLTLSADHPAGGLVKVADLGLALLHEPDSGGPASSANLVIGSLDYMAPEQADDAHQVDRRADLYSLGCTLYELLTGTPPFASPGQTRLQKLKAHADAAIPSLAETSRQLPAGLEPLVRQLLAKIPADRPQTAGDVAAALAPFAAGAGLAPFLEEDAHSVSLLARAPRTATQPSAEPSPASRVAGVPARPGRSLKKRASLCCLAAMLLAGIIYVQTDRGTLEINSDDEEVQVRVEQDGKLITLVDLKTRKEIKLRSGTYDVALGDGADDLALDADDFTLRRGGKQVLQIRRRPPTLLRLPFDADEAAREQQTWARFRGVPQMVKNDLGMKLALIPPGEFEMRSGYQVKISKPYYLGVCEVTVAQFREFAKTVGYQSPLEAEGRGVIVDVDSLKEAPGVSWRSSQLALSDEHPVAGVTWSDAEQFCAWLTQREKTKYRLPTEAEWEWVARTGSAAMFAWGDDWHGGGMREWYSDNSEGHTHPVGAKQPNAWGVCDINGNLVEWCGDWFFNPFPQAEVTDPTGPALSAGSRVLRGGSFHDGATPFSNRGSWVPDSSMMHVGFRVCREL